MNYQVILLKDDNTSLYFLIFASQSDGKTSEISLTLDLSFNFSLNLSLADFSFFV
ncbi:hypothetical protein ONA24_05165 [Mycoplasmopsis cynos]|uniref:hypothetical protein n=1 Tax=Mycoplasmopsis cynos TaxID=171284 RepID=UPI0024CC903D|nr:hypothetical protein [Mycoplasmopsis cynos]MCU9935602.1 hypothetical protein [Mycoplasmopsis cynos]WAM03149.1 hypothetical protein ONA22_05260 [Mycoplasmopsis cynos]WAM09402.1 hypothetical protein ONA24_05165 [Mycoplasmopsis cynos]